MAENILFEQLPSAALRASVVNPPPPHSLDETRRRLGRHVQVGHEPVHLLMTQFRDLSLG